MAISLCMIVKNEADSLGACLESAASCVNEIIVVDTGSTDTTVAVARRHGAQVMFFDWINDFAAARNASLSAATGDWILVLDADERLTAAATENLQRLNQGGSVQGVAPEYVLALTLLRQEEDACQSPYTLLTRFFRNRPDIRFQRPYHETVDDSLEAIQDQDPRWQIPLLPGVGIMHSGYQAEAIARANKFQRARSIMEQHLTQHPSDSYVLNKLGALHVQQQNYPLGLDLLQKGLAAQPSDPFTCYELHYHLGLTYRALQQPALAEQHYRIALTQPVPPLIKLGSYINLGSLLKQTQRMDLAVAEFQAAIQTDPTCAVAYFNLGVVHRNQGNLEAAIQAYRQAISYQPAYAEAHQNLGIALYKQGKLQECVTAFQAAVKSYHTHNNSAAAQKLIQGIQNLGLPKDLLSQAHLL